MKNKNKKYTTKKSPNNFNPIAKYGPRVNKSKIIPRKKFQGPKQEEWS
tara:strand:+ start:79 stop:222 length:144 start_codon:yes stop_codon:yes gene_type:complete